MTRQGRRVVAGAMLAGALAVAAVPGAAASGVRPAHWQPHGGVFLRFGPPIPGVPPAYHPPYGHGRYPGHPSPVAGEGCYAGAYVCPLDRPAPIGAPCACRTGQGTAWGRAR